MIWAAREELLNSFVVSLPDRASLRSLFFSSIVSLSVPGLLRPFQKEEKEAFFALFFFLNSFSEKSSSSMEVSAFLPSAIRLLSSFCVTLFDSDHLFKS